MNKFVTLSLTLLISAAAGGVSAQALTGCAAKKADVQTQLEQAQKHGNQAQEAKLKIAQKQLNANCTDEGLRREREADIKKKEQQVAKRRTDLEKAQAKGKSDKIAKQEKKLQDAEAELKQAQDKLSM
jgi:DNA repair exonuclease SbcCD ATPase subunit